MKLREIYLIETTEEDRALVSISKSLSEKLNKEYSSEYMGPAGKISDFFESPLPILNSINIEIDSEQGIEDRLNKDTPDDEKIINSDTAGVWFADDKTIVINNQYLANVSLLQSILTHELRHALDDFKSNFRVSKSNSYFTPKKKDHRRKMNDPYFGDISYLAEPAEINARFAQVLNQLVTTIPQALRVNPNNPRPIIMKELNNILAHHQISDLFPEKETSKDYKRLIKRSVDFIDKELNYLQSNQKN